MKFASSLPEGFAVISNAQVAEREARWGRLSDLFLQAARLSQAIPKTTRTRKHAFGDAGPPAKIIPSVEQRVRPGHDKKNAPDATMSMIRPPFLPCE